MKNIFVIAIGICFLYGCGNDKAPQIEQYMIYFDFIDRPLWESWPDRSAVLNVKMNIHSEFNDDAYLVLYSSGKQFRPCTRYLIYVNSTSGGYTKDSTVYHPVIYEPFRDSLKMDGFHIRSYVQYIPVYYPNDALAFPVDNPVDYPLYFKKIRVKKGKNRENFKIVFPRNIVEIPSFMDIVIGVGRYNDETKNLFEEKYPGYYELSEFDKERQNLYFETFPDSSKTSFVFSAFLMEYISFVPDEPQKFNSVDLKFGIIRGKYYGRSWRIKLNWYVDAPYLECDECIIHR